MDGRLKVTDGFEVLIDKSWQKVPEVERLSLDFETPYLLLQ